MSKGIGKGQHPNSKKALIPTQTKKGGPTHPGVGRPKGSLSLKERMSKFLDLDVKVKMPNGSIKDQTVLDSIILSLLHQAQKGNIQAVKEVLERNFGKEDQGINVKSSFVDKLKDL